MLQAVLLQEGGGPVVSVFLIMVLIFGLIAVVGFVLWLGLAYYFYNDAQKRNMDTPVLWGGLVFFTGVIGVTSSTA